MDYQEFRFNGKTSAIEFRARVAARLAAPPSEDVEWLVHEMVEWLGVTGAGITDAIDEAARRYNERGKQCG